MTYQLLVPGLTAQNEENFFKDGIETDFGLFRFDRTETDLARKPYSKNPIDRKIKTL